MSKWVAIQNSVLIAAFCLLVIVPDGQAKAWAIAPLLFINFPSSK